jgi:hypothetical protein
MLCTGGPKTIGGQMVLRVKEAFSAISQAVFSANFLDAQYHKLAA